MVTIDDPYVERFVVAEAAAPTRQNALVLVRRGFRCRLSVAFSRASPAHARLTTWVVGRLLARLTRRLALAALAAGAAGGFTAFVATVVRAARLTLLLGHLLSLRSMSTVPSASTRRRNANARIAPRRCAAHPHETQEAPRKATRTGGFIATTPRQNPEAWRAAWGKAATAAPRVRTE